MALDKICGIYKITNNLNGKCYVGQSIDIYKRWREHKNAAYQNHQFAKPLYRAFRKYGIENFTFEILQKCKRCHLDEREEYWIKKCKACSEGYNLNSGGHSHCGSWNKYQHGHLRDYRRWQKPSNYVMFDTRPNIAKTFQEMKYRFSRHAKEKRTGRKEKKDRISGENHVKDIALAENGIRAFSP